MCGDIFAAARLWRGRLLTAGHLLHVALEMAAVAVLPCAHSVQAAEPLVSLKLLASHAVHSTPSGPV